LSEPSPGGEHGPLERLCGDEAELERSLESARREAAAAVAEARGQAERIASEARAALEAELTRLRAEAEEEVAREALRAREGAVAEVDALARRAERNRPRALARLLEIVLGRAAP
jgi:F0F1-type ATP synthase membrane subunit b/b'